MQTQTHNQTTKNKNKKKKIILKHTHTKKMKADVLPDGVFSTDVQLAHELFDGA
jgi:hypothetical protein